MIQTSITSKLLLIVIERNHLWEELIGDLVHWGHLIGSNSYLDILDLSDNGLELRVIDAIQRFDNF
jgi:hypothetical protein